MATKIYKRKIKKHHTRRHMKGGTKTSEDACKYVSSRGILKSCFIHSLNPASSTKTLDGIDLSKIKEGCTVYITGSAIPEFAKHLNEINHKFILVSGDCDDTMPDDVFKNEIDFNNFINSEKIIHWYSQNCTKVHPKLSIIPIGLDYHSTSDRNKKLSPIEEEKTFNDIIASSKPFYERDIKCYSNFYLNKDASNKYYNRRNAIDNVPKELVTYEMQRVNKNISFTNQIKHAFVLSPHGVGLDCHRTWEALCLGCIPIVKKSQLDTLYTDLPVLIINNWSDVSQDLLNKTVSDFKQRTFNYEKLKLKYWIDIIHSSV